MLSFFHNSFLFLSTDLPPTHTELLEMLRCLEEGAKEFIIKPVQMADVERIKAHICPVLGSVTPVSCHLDQPSVVSCNKRKFDAEGFETQGSDRRRPQPSGVIVA